VIITASREYVFEPWSALGLGGLEQAEAAYETAYDE
jgi:hypothetical protein